MSPSEHRRGLYGVAVDHAVSDSGGRWVALPCLDSTAHAERCRRDLALSRERAAQLGQSAFEAIERGVYVDGRTAKPPWCSAPGDAVRSATIRSAPRVIFMTP